ncbi:hypothetical protein EUGRSUZ_L03260 [Eucalyptus grandis]|uniref:Flavin-containing monooxygenase n=1 Tax=Eucalyptus grandis TaxID=71139 RepID=A0AAD9T8V5_EUCGR|nr:hypothetical protein EUGRSUZ_L03260 [Eucalyptus grandis]
MQSTRLQNEKEDYRTSTNSPSHTEVLDYVNYYAQHFNLYPYIKFHSRVIYIDYVGVSSEEMKTWDLWGGTGTAFNSRGGKSAVDLAIECAEANGVEYPCVMIRRNPHWLLPSDGFLINYLGYLYFNRFAGLLHKPGENFLYWLLATVLSPLRWGISKFSEIYLRWKLPLKKYVYVVVVVVPDKQRRSPSFHFCREGLIVSGEDKPISSDLVILATGYKGDQKLKNIFRSSVFQEHLIPSPTSTIPLYRQVIHPLIPQLTRIGYAEGLASLPTTEIRCQWLLHLLEGNIKLPSIRVMEEDTVRWEIHMKQYGGKGFWRSCIGTINIWYNDQLCKDMNCNPRRKRGFLAEWFQSYGPIDYAGLTNQKH